MVNSFLLINSVSVMHFECTYIITVMYSSCKFSFYIGSQFVRCDFQEDFCSFQVQDQHVWTRGSGLTRPSTELHHRENVTGKKELLFVISCCLWVVLYCSFFLKTLPVYFLFVGHYLYIQSENGDGITAEIYSPFFQPSQTCWVLLKTCSDLLCYRVVFIINAFLPTIIKLYI